MSLLGFLVDWFGFGMCCLLAGCGLVWLGGFIVW